MVAAFAAALLFAGTTVAADRAGVGSEPIMLMAFALLSLPFVLLAVFRVGVVGWRYVSAVQGNDHGGDASGGARL